MVGPLQGTTIIEVAGIGPGPFAGMMLADMGARVISVDRPWGNPGATYGHDVLFRSRQHVAIDLRKPEGVEVLLRLAEQADGLYEGMRPGVAERLGFGPDICRHRNPRLVFGRVTGWGQDGPLAALAGHDINYIALSGVLHSIGRRGEKPTVPLNLVGDFGGGGMLLAYGMVCGILYAARTGQGQVIDAAMIDGAGAMMAMFADARFHGDFSLDRGENLLDGGAPFYDVYETADSRYISLGAIEPLFYEQLVKSLGLADSPDFAPEAQRTTMRWPVQKGKIAAVVKCRTRDEWDAILGGTDVCYAPVLDLDEVPLHPHHIARETHVKIDGVIQTAPAPRFSRTTPGTPASRQPIGSNTTDILLEHGYSEGEIGDLLSKRAVMQA